MGQSTRHFKLCVFLWAALRRVVDRSSTVGADNFVYFDGADASRKCAPDAFVKLGVPKAHYESWLTWDVGAPELCVEILSPSDTKEAITAETKLERFETMGIREVIFFDVDAAEGSRLRAWDRVDGKLVPRAVSNERTPCKTLRRWFHVGPLADEPVALFLADDEAGDGRVLTHDEARMVAEEGRRFFEAKWIAAEEARRAAEANAAAAAANAASAEEARLAAEAKLRAADARIQELEERLRSKG